MTRNVALVTRVTGHIGADIARILIDKGYEMHGIERRASLFNTDRIDTLSQTPMSMTGASYCVAATSPIRAT